MAAIRHDTVGSKRNPTRRHLQALRYFLWCLSPVHTLKVGTKLQHLTPFMVFLKELLPQNRLLVTQSKDLSFFLSIWVRYLTLIPHCKLLNSGIYCNESPQHHRLLNSTVFVFSSSFRLSMCLINKALSRRTGKYIQ